MIKFSTFTTFVPSNHICQFIIIIFSMTLILLFDFTISHYFCILSIISTIFCNFNISFNLIWQIKPFHVYSSICTSNSVIKEHGWKMVNMDCQLMLIMDHFKAKSSYESCHEKNGTLHRRKQRSRSALW